MKTTTTLLLSLLLSSGFAAAEDDEHHGHDHGGHAYDHTVPEGRDDGEKPEESAVSAVPT